MTYGMYTKEGNDNIDEMFRLLKSRLQVVVKRLSEYSDDIEKYRPGYTDTAVREAVGAALADLLYEATEYFGEAVKIDGKSFQDYVARRFMNREL